MPVFLERYVLAILATVTVYLAITNPMGFDLTQRITGCAALMFLAYFIGHTIHKSREPTTPKPPETEIAVNPLPDFKLSLMGVNLFIANKVGTKWTGLGLSVRIRNAGAESIATDWVLEIQLADGTKLYPQLTKIPDTLTLSGPQSAIIRATDSLDALSFNNKISTGTAMEGVLLFYTPTDKALIDNENTVFRLSVQDVSGRKFTAEQRMGDWLHP